MDQYPTGLKAIQSSGDTNTSQSTASNTAGVLQEEPSKAGFPAWSYAYYLGFLATIGGKLVICALIVYRVNRAARARRNEAEPVLGPSPGAQIKQQDNYAKHPTLASWGTPDPKWRKEE